MFLVLYTCVVGTYQGWLKFNVAGIYLLLIFENLTCDFAADLLFLVSAITTANPLV